MKWYYLPIVTAASLAASMALAAEKKKAKAPAPATVTAAAVKKAPPEAPPPAWLDTLSIDGYIEGGIAMNFNQPFNKWNWGHL